VSYDSTTQGFAELNSVLLQRYKAGEAIPLTVQDKPKLHILSLVPLVYEKFGSFRDRAPGISGTLALRGFVTAPHPDGGAIVYAALEADGQIYGFGLGTEVGPDPRTIINSVAIAAGHPELQLLPPGDESSVR